MPWILNLTPASADITTLHPDKAPMYPEPLALNLDNQYAIRKRLDTHM